MSGLLHTVRDRVAVSDCRRNFVNYPPSAFGRRHKGTYGPPGECIAGQRGYITARSARGARRSTRTPRPITVANACNQLTCGPPLATASDDSPCVGKRTGPPDNCNTAVLTVLDWPHRTFPSRFGRSAQVAGWSRRWRFIRRRQTR